MKSHLAFNRLIASFLHLKGKAFILDSQFQIHALGLLLSQYDSGQLKLALKLGVVVVVIFVMGG